MAILEDGHSTLITLENLPNIELCEKTVKPPGISGGGSNDLTSMKNNEWRTFAAKKLKTLTEASATVFYDPIVYESGRLPAQINVNQKITVTFSDGSKVEFYGWLDTFEPDDVEEGAPPEATVTFIPSNRNLAGDEIAPLYIPAP